ncbi:TetR family transcriptional regulator [Gordonia sp. SID5947]|uniref:TetR family transcriptional regulator C-terminal domain-containing protein n=1 Tax=Gordonia sp. SID5947 TaxID=2690315 RepID=UPI00136F1B3F|nr:TetR family transcriptional regulator [Gordonia sp. SID5947]
MTSPRRRAPLTASDLDNAVLAVAAEHGLTNATIRNVAAHLGVSIGAVQHHFPTKDALYISAFTALVDRVTQRIDAVGHADDGALEDVLMELLPIDSRRRAEAQVMIEFSALATRAESLAAIQERTLARIRAALCDALSARGVDAPGVRATALLAMVDGLALHASSTTGAYPQEALDSVLRHQLTLILD